MTSASLPNVLEVPHGEIPEHYGAMGIRFTVPVSNVNIRVGRKWSAWDESAVLRAYDEFGGLVDRASVNLGGAAHDITMYLAVDGEGDEIHRIEVHYFWLTSLDGIPIETDRGGVEIIDNLTFQSLEDPSGPSDTIPPSVNITVPTNGQVFFGDSYIVLEGTISEAFGLGDGRIERVLGGRQGALPADLLAARRRESS